MRIYRFAMTNQLELFAPPPRATVSPLTLREEERFGRMDFRCRLPLRNDYSTRLMGQRLAAYERGWLNAWRCNKPAT